MINKPPSAICLPVKYYRQTDGFVLDICKKGMVFEAKIHELDVSAVGDQCAEYG